MADSTDSKIEQFIKRWEQSGAAERANYALFLSELCDVLDVPRPDPMQTDEEKNTYVFEKPVTFNHPGSTQTRGRIDLYRAGSFVLEAKQGSSPVQLESEVLTLSAEAPRRSSQPVRGTRRWDKSMLGAYGQACNYARALPDWPPFVLVVDVGHCIELYSDFDQMGKGYLHFPDPRSHRIFLDDLHKAEVRETLRKVWLDPMSLDPSQYAAQVTRKVAAGLAKLGMSLEKTHHPKDVADFLMRCLFTMFAEDVGLLPPESFTLLLKKHRENPEHLQPMVEALWKEMDRGGFSIALGQNVLRFNGRFFLNPTALLLTTAQIDLLVEAADADWSEVEPAIFGTLVERALDPRERHRLGAHYTPRAYVERLVLPTVIEPLRREWESVQAAAFTLVHRETGASSEKDEKRRKLAVKSISDFHSRLCEVRVLDPACGTGNFLYVTLDLMKRLEGEVLQTLHDLGEGQTRFELEGITVNPGQFFGIEVNPRASSIAELVLWLGYLQWHFRTHGKVSPPEPVLTDYKNIENRDAVLAFDNEEIATDEDGNVMSQWDGETYKKHPTTGEHVPDETARKPIYEYTNPRKAEWPSSDFIIGNPPFIGDKRMRDSLGGGYVEKLRYVYPGLGKSSDYVLYWWDKAAELVRNGGVKRFGFIATNSLKQIFNRRLLRYHMETENPISLVFAIPDHPWVDTKDGAAIRICMTVGQAGQHQGDLHCIVKESESDKAGVSIKFVKESGMLLPDLTIGADVAGARPLKSNEGIANVGVALHARGLALDAEGAHDLKEQCRHSGIEDLGRYIKPTLNGRDLTQISRASFVLDLYGVSESSLLALGPIYQWVHDRVLPARETNRRASYRKNWWIFGEPRPDLRHALIGLNRYIATPLTSTNRFFVFLDATIVPDQALVVVASSDPAILGILSSKPHVLWALASGARLGVGNDPRYNKTRCFDPFPFPVATKDMPHIRAISEALDSHRKSRQEAHPGLTLTGMYNVLRKLRSGEVLSAGEKIIYEQGLCTVLLKMHDDLDFAVFSAYGWPAKLDEREILARLVELNRCRAEEEAQGAVRWIRPDFQNPDGARQPSQVPLAGVVVPKTSTKKKLKKLPWPKSLVERVQAVQVTMASLEEPAMPKEIARHFTRARVVDVNDLLETLQALGQVYQLDDGRFTV